MTTLTLAGHKYEATLLLRQCGSAPRIEVNVADINDGSNPDHVPVLLDFDGIIFYKQHGKMTVILGDVEKHTKNGKVKGILLSGPAIKKTRIDQPSFFQQPAPASKSSYPPAFRNNPRMFEHRSNTR